MGTKDPSQDDLVGHNPRLHPFPEPYLILFTVLPHTPVPAPLFLGEARGHLGDTGSSLQPPQRTCPRMGPDSDDTDMTVS